MKSVKELREENKLTQEELANKIKMPLSTYRKKELGIRKWYFDEMVKISTVLKIPINDIRS